MSKEDPKLRPLPRWLWVNPDERWQDPRWTVRYILIGLSVLAVFIITTRLILWLGLAPSTRPKHDESLESLLIFCWFTFGFFATWLYEFWEFRHQVRFQAFFLVEVLLHCVAWRGLYLWIGPYMEHRFWLYSLTLLEVWIFGKFLLASVGLEEF